MSIVAPVYKSIVRATSDLIEEIRGTGMFAEVGYHNWESRGDENLLPQHTLLGVEGFSFDENGGLWLIRYGLGLSSYRDANLLNEIDLIDFIHERTGEGSKVPLLEMDRGEQVNELVVTQWQMMPMASSEIRNYRPIGIELKRTGT